jgi:hypothetical protein
VVHAHRRWWAVRAATLIVAVAVAVSGTWWLIERHRSQQPCSQVRAMIDYNKSQRDALANAFKPEQRTQASLAEYQNWADRLKAYAATITDPRLAPQARRLGDEAQQFVSLNAQIRSDTSVPADPAAPPPWTETYIDLNRRFSSDLAALDQACPA